jgi:hypothetical protein
VIETLIERTAEPVKVSGSCGDTSGQSVPNNLYGWSRLDALAALEEISTLPTRAV